MGKKRKKFPFFAHLFFYQHEKLFKGEQARTSLYQNLQWMLLQWNRTYHEGRT